MFLLFAGEGPANNKLRYPAGNYLAGGPALAGFEQSRLSRDCSKNFSLRSLRLCGEQKSSFQTP
jgi:hypothetical protein